MYGLLQGRLVGRLRYASFHRGACSGDYGSFSCVFSDFVDAKECLDEFAWDCHPLVQLHYEGIVDAYEYLCEVAINSE